MWVLVGFVSGELLIYDIDEFFVFEGDILIAGVVTCLHESLIGAKSINVDHAHVALCCFFLSSQKLLNHSLLVQQLKRRALLIVFLVGFY